MARVVVVEAGCFRIGRIYLMLEPPLPRGLLDTRLRHALQVMTVEAAAVAVAAVLQTLTCAAAAAAAVQAVGRSRATHSP